MAPILKFSSTANIMQRLLRNNQLRNIPDISSVISDRENLEDELNTSAPTQNMHDMDEKNILPKGLYELLYAAELTPMDIALTVAEEIFDDVENVLKPPQQYEEFTSLKPPSPHR